MEKIYTYKNAVIYISNLDKKSESVIHKATEKFLKKVLKERMKHGDTNTTGDIRKK